MRRFGNVDGKKNVFLGVMKDGEWLKPQAVADRLGELGYEVSRAEAAMFLRNDMEFSEVESRRTKERPHKQTGMMIMVKLPSKEYRKLKKKTGLKPRRFGKINGGKTT